MSASPPSWERTERRAGNDELLQRLRVFHMLSRDQLAQLPFLTEGVGCALHGDVAERLRSFIQGFHAKAVCLGGMHPDPVLHGANLGANDRVYVTPDADISHAVGLRDTPPQVTDLQKVQRRTYQGVDDGVVLDVYTVHGGARHALCHLRRGATRAEARTARLTQSFDAEFNVRGYDTDFGVDAAPPQQPPPSPPRTTSYSTTRSFYYTPHSAQTPHSSQAPAPAPALASASSLSRAPPPGRSTRLSAAPAFAAAPASGERDNRSLSPPRTRGAAGGLPTFPSTPGRTGGGVVTTAVTTSSRAGTLDGPLSQKTEFLYDLIDGRRTMADQTLPPCPHAMMCPLVSDREHLDTHSHPCPRYFETSECHLRSEASHARYFSHGERRAAASPAQHRPSSPPLWDTAADGGLHKGTAVARGRAPTRAADATADTSPSRAMRARQAQTPSPPPLPLQHPPIPSPLPQQQPPQHPVPASSVPSFVSVPQTASPPRTRLVGATSFNTQPIRLEPAPSPAPPAAAAAAPPSPPQSAASHRGRSTSPATGPLRGPLDVPEPDWRDLFQATLVEFAQSPKPPQPSWSAGAPAPAPAVPAQPSFVDSADAEAVLRAGFDVFPSAAEVHYQDPQYHQQQQQQQQQRQHEHGRHVAPAYKQSRVSWVRSTSGSRSRSKSKSTAFTYANCKPGIPEPSNRPPGAVVRRSQLSPAAARRKPASFQHHTPAAAAAAAPPADTRSSSAARRRPSPAAGRAKRLPAPPATPAQFTPAPKKTATPKAAPPARKPAAASTPAAAAVPSALKKPRAEAPAAKKAAAAPLSTPSAPGYKPSYSAKETVAAKERLFGASAGGSSSSVVSGPSYKPTPKRVDSVGGGSVAEAPAKRRTVIIDGAEVDAEEADRAIARIQATFRGKRVRASMSPPPSQAPPPPAPEAPVVPPPAVEPAASAPNAEEGDDEIAAATRIQALYRGRKGRQSVSPLREERRQLSVAETSAAPARQATPVSEAGQDFASGAATDDENDEKGRTRNTSTAESSSSSSTPQKKSLSSSDSDSS